MAEEKKKKTEEKSAETKAAKKPEAGAADAVTTPAATAAAEGSATPAEGEVLKKKRRSKKRALTDGRVYIHASYNNTLVTVTDPRGNPVVRNSAGMSGFKGTRKSTPYAAQVASEKVLEKAKLLGLERVNVFVKGIGIGRDQALRAVAASGVDIQSITDLTTLPFAGCRPRKGRRV